MSTGSDFTSSVRRSRCALGSRRMSRVTDDEFDELAFMQQQVRLWKMAPNSNWKESLLPAARYEHFGH